MANADRADCWIGASFVPVGSQIDRVGKLCEGRLCETKMVESTAFRAVPSTAAWWESGVSRNCSEYVISRFLVGTTMHLLRQPVRKARIELTY